MGCPLAQRELQALSWASRGMTVKAIARQMGVEVTTIRSHLQRARQKLAVNTTTDAVVACIDAGWLGANSENGTLLRFADRQVTAAQREYLNAFDLHLTADDDARVLTEAKRRTNAALVLLGKSPRSVANRCWIDRLLADIAQLGGAGMSLRETASADMHRQDGGRRDGF